KGRAIFRAVALAEAGLTTNGPSKDDGQITDQEAE
ncbi:MAG: hypothetical protein ACI8ZV_002223, partial [Chitinophagales bacterium]